MIPNEKAFFIFTRRTAKTRRFECSRNKPMRIGTKVHWLRAVGSNTPGAWDSDMRRAIACARAATDVKTLVTDLAQAAEMFDSDQFIATHVASTVQTPEHIRFDLKE